MEYACYQHVTNCDEIVTIERWSKDHGLGILRTLPMVPFWPLATQTRESGSMLVRMEKTAAEKPTRLKTKKSMKSKNNRFCSLALAVGSLAITMVGANAQNNLHAPSDLVLTFQDTANSQTVTVALGNVSTVFRDATPGTTFTPNSANISNLGTTLVTTFGATWYERSTLWMGAIGFRGTNLSSPTLLDLDPPQTIYFSKVRQGVGTEGQANSGVIPTVINDSGSGITGGMGAVKGRIESAGTTAVFAEPSSTSFIPVNNPFTALNVQNVAYTNIAGGVQGQFAVGSFGTFSSGAVELALDLYRIQYANDRTNSSGVQQYGFGEPIRQGEYLGTITINQQGAVGFTTVIPEPTTVAMLGLAGLVGLLSGRNRKSPVNA
jgi:hypothetical protein